MRYIYFVFYSADGGRGMGNAEILMDKPVTSIEDVRGIERAIQDTGKTGVVIINYSLLRTEEA